MTSMQRAIKRCPETMVDRWPDRRDKPRWDHYEPGRTYPFRLVPTRAVMLWIRHLANV